MKTIVNIIKIILISLMVCLCAGSAVNTSLQAQEEKSEKETKKDIRIEFKKAKKLMRKKEWREAAKLFGLFVENNSDSSLTDDSLYWLAYSLKGLNKTVRDSHQLLESMELALSKLDALMEDFPTSKWVDDAKVLRVEIAEELVQKGFKQYSSIITRAGSNGSTNDNSDLKIAAIHALMNTNPKKGFPILEKMALMNKSRKLRKTAIFLLSQCGDKRVIPLLKKIATQDKDRKIKENAIFYLGQTGKPEAIKELIAIYKTLGPQDGKIKEKIVFTLSQTANKNVTKQLIAIYKKEKDLEIKKKILFWLGQSGSDEAMNFIQKILTEDTP